MRRLLSFGSVILIAVLLARCTAQEHIVSKKQNIVSGNVLVEAGKDIKYRIDIQPDMLEATLNGEFMASGGAGNDIAAIVADESNCMNWMNGHEAQVLWGTHGQKTTGHFELKLDPGTYYLAVSNSFSIITDKNVTLDVGLTYKQKESTPH